MISPEQSGMQGLAIFIDAKNTENTRFYWILPVRNVIINIMDNKEAYIIQLESTIKNLEKQVSNLTEMILLMRKKKFGSSSEKTPKSESGVQLNLFNEAEAEASTDTPEPVVKHVNGYLRTATKTKREELLKDLPVVEIECKLPEEDHICPKCNTRLDPIGRETVREELEYIPAQLKVIRYIRLAYGCPECKKKGEPYIAKALTPTSLMNHSLASPSTVAHVMYQKYVNGMPLYRQEKDWEQLGFALSRATMANWIIRCSQDWLAPVVGFLKQELLKRDVIHCDETPVQVLKEPGKAPQTKSYMWVYRSGMDAQPPIVLYDYQPSRGGKNAAGYLKGFNGFLQTDAYSGYERVENVIRCCCWAHVRRYFMEAIPDVKNKDAPKSNSEIGRDYCNQLFEIERTLFDLPPDKRKEERLKLEKPVLDAFWSWLEKLSPMGGSRLAKAVTYACNQKPYLENYLLDGRCSISNNIAENSIRPFTVGRKNWLFSDTPRGADASAIVYSIVETAKANNLNVFTYLNYLLLYMPDMDYKNDLDAMEGIMPWSERVRQECGK